jgi:hypothetical protein
LNEGSKLHNQFLLHKSISQSKLAASTSKKNFKKYMMDALSQISYSSDDEDTKESPSNDFLQDFFFFFFLLG